MIASKEMINKLKEFGLNSYEAKLWIALLSKGMSTAGELSDISNVPRSRAYDVLESLERKGFVMLKLGKPIKYIAMSPTDAIERLKKRICEEMKKQIAIIDRITKSTIMKELSLIYQKSIKKMNPEDFVGAIRGRKNCYAHLQGMFKRAKESIIIFTTEHGLIRKHRMFMRAFEKACKAGIDVKIAAPITELNKQSAIELSKNCSVKHSEQETRLCIVDGKELLMMLAHDTELHPNFDIGIWINSPFIASFLHAVLGRIF